MKWFVLDGLSEMVCHSGMDEMDHNGGIFAKVCHSPKNRDYPLQQCASYFLHVESIPFHLKSSPFYKRNNEDHEI